MTTQLATLQSVQDKVKERIQASFMDLLPPELFEGMVQQHLKTFTDIDLPKLVKEAATARLNELLRAEFLKPEWQETWFGGNAGPQASDAVLEIVKKAAPDLVAHFFGGIVQHVVMDIRNNPGRY